MAEAVGRAAEDVQLGVDVSCAGDLRRRHAALLGDEVKIAVNRTLSSDEAVVGDDDEIAFLPPVSGG